MRTAVGVVLASLAAASAAKDASTLPNIVFLLIDDLGWAEVGYHRPAGYHEVQTPNMDALVAEGIELDRGYAYKLCSPTRSAIQSGRNPIHVNAQNLAMTVYDPQNPEVGVSGIPRNMTGMATRLAEAGYKNRVYSGKADFGMAWPEQTPLGRGYNNNAFYYNHMIDYWSFNVGTCEQGRGRQRHTEWMRDLTGNRSDGTYGPLFEKLNPDHCLVQNMTDPENKVAPFPKDIAGCTYVEDIITNHTVDAIMAHDPSDGPLFAFHASHSIHTPLEVVPDAYDRFDFIDTHYRRTYHSMVWNVDRAIGRIVDALKAKGMWNNTLIVSTSDNGGPIYKQGSGGGNNYPLRGGKAGNWEGGIRASAFVSGGAVPPAMRGKKLDGLVAAWDWYATFIEGVAGLDPTDRHAAEAGLPPIDSINQWDYITGKTATPPRRNMPIGTEADPTDIWCSGRDIVVHSVIAEDGVDSGKLWKLMLGSEPQNIWTGPEYPNATTLNQPDTGHVFGDCGFDPGCLFELRSDPSEHHNVAAENPDVVKALRGLITRYNSTVFKPVRPDARELACAVANERYFDNATGFGFWGPFVGL